MSTPIDARQVRRWQDEVARDPGSASFLPLAEMYRREGRLEVARRLCIRGLEKQAENVEGHVLLGRLYRENGDLEKAYDEMDIALGLDPSHPRARRAIGYLCLERRDWQGASRHLDVAARVDPSDERIASALALARRHLTATTSPDDPAAPSVAETLSPLLQGFVRESRVRLVILIEGSGKILARHGVANDLDLAAFASLGAGIQSASRALAGVLGEPRFEQLYQGEGERQIFLAPIQTPTGEVVLIAAFGSDTNIGLVRLHFGALASSIAVLDWPISSRRLDAAGFESNLRAGLTAPSSDSRFPNG